MRFACDAMLGKLARWLRLSGYDTAYQPEADDGELLRACREERRILLTRDVELAGRAKGAGVEVVLVESEHIEEQLVQLVRELGITLRASSGASLCPVCNTPLVEAEQVERPEHLGDGEVYTCPGCGRVYWEGSHWRSIAERVRRVEQKVRGR